MQLHYTVEGSGRPLVILHGLFGSLDNWRAQAKELSRLFQVYRLDLRNHGNSPHSDVMDYPAMAEDLREFLSARGLASAFILGHSMGGKAAMQFATAHPGMVEKLAVVDIAPKNYPPEHEKIIQALLSLKLEDFHSRPEVDAALSKKIPDAAVRRFLLKNLTRGDGGLRWRMNLKAIEKNYRTLCKTIEPSPGPGFEKPACFIRGAESKYVTEADYGRIIDLFPRAILPTVGNAGHWVHVDNPQGFAEAVTKFLMAEDSWSG
jgi:pimeloyl-ACP methyl ester carboxylesterase